MKEHPVPQRFRSKDIVDGIVLPNSRVRYLEKSGVQELDALGTGMFFILAWWSGPAFVALDHLAKAIPRLDQDGKLDLWIADTDNMPDLYCHPLLNGKIHGGGESIWKRQWQVMDTFLVSVKSRTARTESQHCCDSGLSP